MEDWQLDFEWLRLRHEIKDRMKLQKLPDLQAILFLIGIQELGEPRLSFSKEEKQDLMHIAVCRLLSYDGVYELKGYDDEGWPHWEARDQIAAKGVEKQERLLKEKVLQYFQLLDTEAEPTPPPQQA